VGRGLVVALALLALWPSSALAGVTQESIAVSDGVTLAATLYEPDTAPPAGGFPGVIVAHGLGGSRGTMVPVAQALLQAGYAVVAYDARGHGESGGLITIAGPREVADLREVFAWLKARPETSDTRIGAYGVSYGGGTIWQAAVEGVPFAAIVPVIAWTNLVDALFPQNLPKSGVIAGFLGALPVDRTAPEINAVRRSALTGDGIGSLVDLAAQRSAFPRLRRGGFRVPTFVQHGRRDFVFDLEQARQAYRVLDGPKRLYVGNIGHTPATNPPAEQAYLVGQTVEWLDRFLKGTPNGIDARPPVEIAPETWTGATRKLAALPATSPLYVASETLRFARKGRRVRESTFTTIGDRGKVVRTFAPLRRASETFGPATVTVTARTPGRWRHLVAILSAVTPSGREIVVTGGGVPTASLRGTETKLTIRLLSQMTAIPARSRLRVTLAGASTAQNGSNLLYLLGADTGDRISIGRVELRLPLLTSPLGTP
jgi:predicted acyl esterase